MCICLPVYLEVQPPNFGAHQCMSCAKSHLPVGILSLCLWLKGSLDYSCRVICTGHSLGGALATLCALWCASVRDSSNVPSLLPRVIPSLSAKLNQPSITFLHDLAASYKCKVLQDDSNASISCSDRRILLSRGLRSFSASHLVSQPHTYWANYFRHIRLKTIRCGGCRGFSRSSPFLNVLMPGMQDRQESETGLLQPTSILVFQTPSVSCTAGIPYLACQSS